LMAIAGRGPSERVRATIAVTAGPGVSAATATTAVNAAKEAGGIGRVWAYSQPLRRK
jgi:hypothetical protein